MKLQVLLDHDFHNINSSFSNEEFITLDNLNLLTIEDGGVSVINTIQENKPDKLDFYLGERAN